MSFLLTICVIIIEKIYILMILNFLRAVPGIQNSFFYMIYILCFCTEENYVDSL